MKEQNDKDEKPEIKECRGELVDLLNHRNIGLKTYSKGGAHEQQGRFKKIRNRSVMYQSVGDEDKESEGIDDTYRKQEGVDLRSVAVE